MYVVKKFYCIHVTFIAHLVKKTTHVNCLRNVKPNDPIYTNRNENSWFCTTCMEDALPFINIVDDDDYLCIVRENLYQIGDARIDELNSNTFLLNELTEMDDIDLNDPLLGNDPDIHFYQSDNILSKPSNYYNTDTFCDKFEYIIDEKNDS